MHHNRQMKQQPFNKIKQELRTLFFQKGWGMEIEGVSPEYYKVYVTVLEFINEKFYGNKESKEDILDNSARDKKGYSKCNKCGRKRVYYRIITNDYKCRKCNILYDGKGMIIKAEEMPKEEPIKDKLKEHLYFLCTKCGKRKSRYRKLSDDYKCRLCKAVFKKPREIDD